MGWNRAIRASTNGGFPPAAKYGEAKVTVTTKARTSNAVSFAVKR